MYRKFKPLNIPYGWEQYWSKYPNGYSILEALIDWVSQVDDMVENQNELSDTVKSFGERIDEFINQFGAELQTTVTDTLQDWQTSGFLDVVISEALQWQLDDYITTNEQDKNVLTTQLTYNTNYINNSEINAMCPPVPLVAVKGDGTDETTAFQNILNASIGKRLYIPLQQGSNYLTGQLIIPSNIIIEFQPGVLFKATDDLIQTDPGFEALFRLEGSENVTIYANNAVFYMNKSAYSGEHNHIFMINGAKNVSIYDANANDSGGDGFYISGFNTSRKHSENVKLIRCKANNNRRQGLSIISVNGLIVDDCDFGNTDGTSPMAAIDIEPEHYTDYLSDIKINNCRAKNNTGVGYIIALDRLPLTVEVSIEFNNCLAYGNARGYRIDSVKDNSKGKITFINCESKNSKFNGWYESDTSSTGISKTFINCNSIDDNENNSSAQAYGYGAGWFMEDVDDIISKQGNSSYVNCKTIDNRSTKKIKRGFSLYKKTADFENLEYIDCDVNYAEVTEFLFDDNIDKINIKHKKEFTRSIVTSNLVARYLGYTHSNGETTGPINITLTESRKGYIYHLRVDKPNMMIIIPKEDQQILGVTDTIGQTLRSDKVGSKLTLIGRSDGNWEVSNMVGEWNNV